MANQDRLGSENAVNIALAIQRLGRDAYGVTIRREIAVCTGKKMSIAILYSQLARLERDGMVRAREGDPTPERLGRPKRLYELTGKGQRALKSALSGFDRLRAPLLASAFDAVRDGVRRACPIILSLLIWIGWQRLASAEGGDAGGVGGGVGDGGGGGDGPAISALVSLGFWFSIGGTVLGVIAAAWTAREWKLMLMLEHQVRQALDVRLNHRAASPPYLLDAICGLLFPPKKRKTILADLLEFYREDRDEWKERYGRRLGSVIAGIYYVRNALEMALSCYFQLVLELIKAWRKGA